MLTARSTIGKGGRKRGRGKAASVTGPIVPCLFFQLISPPSLPFSLPPSPSRLRACVDTGASTTVMSLAMARECGLLSHIDTSVVGGVKGVGFAKILGCVHEAKIL